MTLRTSTTTSPAWEKVCGKGHPSRQGNIKVEYMKVGEGAHSTGRQVEFGMTEFFHKKPLRDELSLYSMGE